MDPTITTEADPPSMKTAHFDAPNSAAAPEVDPLVKTWFNRIRAAEKRWSRFHQRCAYNRKLVRGIEDNAEPKSPAYNKQRANLIQSTIGVVLSKVYAKNPEMAAEPTNKGSDLRLLCDTVSTVTQTMLEDAKLKRGAKRAVRAAMTCSFGIVKLQYQRDIRTDPVIQSRIKDSQDNVLRIEALLAQIEGDEAQRCDLEAKKRELEQAIAGLEAQKEVVAAEGLVIDRVRTERLLFDTAIEDIWDYASSDWMVEKIYMRKSRATGLFPGFELAKAATFKPSEYAGDGDAKNRPIYGGSADGGEEDPMILVYEAWSQVDNTIFTMVAGIETQFAKEPYQPEFAPERWYPYHVLPWASVDGEFVAQSLVDSVEKLQEEHNETRDKFADVRKNIRPHLTVSASLSDKQIQRRIFPDIGEILVVDTGGEPLGNYVQEGAQLTIDPKVYDTSPIRADWEMVSGLQDAARSVVVQPKTATEAAISNQSLAARVEEFRDQVEDWLTELSQAAAELCMLAMPAPMVEQIMGAPQQPAMPAPEEIAMAAAAGAPMPVPEPPRPTYQWPEQRTPDAVFSLIQMKIRAGTTAAPNKLEVQENWSRALPLLREMIMLIRQIEATGGDATPERELVKETAARFDESIDVDRFLPPKPSAGVPAMAGPGGIPMPAGGPLPQISGAEPGMPQPGGFPATPPAPIQ